MMHDPRCFEVHHYWISDEQRAALFQRAAVVVLPYISATQSGVVPVAYTFGKPVVATRVGALPDCIEDGRTGLLVPPRDERALAEAIVTLLLDQQRRHEMGAAGRRKLQHECAPQVVAQKTVEVYQQAVRQRLDTRRQQTPGVSKNVKAAAGKEQVTPSA
jgi:glycosyltransferase involved in cell wall biosynthesis